MKIKVNRRDINDGRYAVKERCGCPIHIALTRKLGYSDALEIPSVHEARIGKIKIPLPQIAVRFQLKLMKNEAAEVEPFEFETTLVEPN